MDTQYVVHTCPGQQGNSFRLTSNTKSNMYRICFQKRHGHAFAQIAPSAYLSQIYMLQTHLTLLRHFHTLELRWSFMFMKSLKIESKRCVSKTCLNQHTLGSLLFTSRKRIAFDVRVASVLGMQSCRPFLCSGLAYLISRCICSQSAAAAIPVSAPAWQACSFAFCTSNQTVLQAKSTRIVLYIP